MGVAGISDVGFLPLSVFPFPSPLPSYSLRGAEEHGFLTRHGWSQQGPCPLTMGPGGGWPHLGCLRSPVRALCSLFPALLLLLQKKSGLLLSWFTCENTCSSIPLCRAGTGALFLDVREASWFTGLPCQICLSLRTFPLHLPCSISGIM